MVCAVAGFEGRAVSFQYGAADMKGMSCALIAPPPNKSLRRTERTVTRLAHAIAGISPLGTIPNSLSCGAADL